MSPTLTATVHYEGSAQTLANPLLNTCLIHPPFLVERNTEGLRTPLKMTLGGSFVPSAATASVTVKLRFSAPQVFTGTVQLPLNSSERVDGSSKRIGVSSML